MQTLNGYDILMSFFGEQNGTTAQRKGREEFMADWLVQESALQKSMFVLIIIHRRLHPPPLLGRISYIQPKYQMGKKEGQWV